MRVSKNRRLNLSRYEESRIRHFHHTLDKYLGLVDAKSGEEKGG